LRYPGFLKVKEKERSSSRIHQKKIAGKRGNRPMCQGQQIRSRRGGRIAAVLAIEKEKPGRDSALLPYFLIKETGKAALAERFGTGL